MSPSKGTKYPSLFTYAPCPAQKRNKTSVFTALSKKAFMADNKIVLLEIEP